MLGIDRKKLIVENEDIIGFIDESSPQTTANTVRMCSFHEPVRIKNTSLYRANTFGFYSMNGKSTVEFHEHSKREDVMCFLEGIRSKNTERRIVAIIDNFKSHDSLKTKEKAEELGILLVSPPPYSPDLNPIEFIWKASGRRHLQNSSGLKSILSSF
jgi:transposase